MSTSTTAEYGNVLAEAHVQAAIVYNPFDVNNVQTARLVWGPERTLADYLVDLPEPQHWTVAYGGNIVAPDEWASIVPDPLSLITIVRTPYGGRGGKQVMRIAALLALAFFAPGLGTAFAGTSMGGSIAATLGMSATAFGAAAGATIMTVGAMTINAVIPPNAGLKSKAEGQTYGVDGPKNTAQEGVPVPVVYGTHRIAGNIVDLFTRNVGDTQYMYYRTVLNDGEVDDITDILINDQPASYFNVKDPGSVEVRIGKGADEEEPNDWFNESIRLINRQTKLTTNWATFKTSGAVDKLRVDVVFPTGLYYAKDDGRKVSQSVTFVAEIRTIDPVTQQPTGAWGAFPTDSGYQPYYPTSTNETALAEDLAARMDIGDLSTRLASGSSSYETSFTLSDASSKPKRLTYQTPKLQRAAYEVRWRRTVNAEEGTKSFTDCYVTDFGEIDLETVNLNGIANVSLKIKMNETISGIPTVTALVKGSKVAIYNEEGVQVDRRWSNNPSHIVTDLLHNKRRGGTYSLDRQNWAKAVEFAEWCEENEFAFNGVFDETRSIWDTAQLVAKVGHASILPRGTKLSFVIDKPGTPEMVFTGSNIIAGTFKKSWLSIDERANEIQLQFADEDDAFKQKTIRITDDAAINRGDRIKPTTINGFGITNTLQAIKEARYQARSNSYIRQTIEFDAPLEAIGLNIGDIALIQHDAISFDDNAGGRLAAGCTNTSIILDRPVKMTAGASYALLVVHSALKRYDITVTDKSGDRLTVTGLPANPSRVARLKAAGKDVEVLRITAGSGGYAYITVSDGDVIPTGAAELWDVSVIEERDVVFAAGETDELTLTAPLSIAPNQYANFMFGKKASIREPFRLKRIKDNGPDRRTLSWVQYDDRVYQDGSFGSVIIDKPVKPTIAHVTQLTAAYSVVPTPTQERIPVDITWGYPEGVQYGGADVYVRMEEGLSFQYIGTANGVSFFQKDFSRGQSPTFKVVAFDDKGLRAPVSNAPTYTLGGGADTITIETPKNLAYTVPYYRGDAVAELVWEAGDDTQEEIFRVEKATITAEQAMQLTAYIAQQAAADAAADANPEDAISRAQLPLPFPATFEVVGTTPDLKIQAPRLDVGVYAIRVRAEKGFSRSLWAYLPITIGTASLPGQINGLRLNGGAPDVPSAQFSTADANWTWNDILAQAVGTKDAAYNLADYQVRILTQSLDVIRTEYTRSPSYSYTLAKNAEDAAKAGVSPRRNFVIEVTIRGLQGQVSAPKIMLATNPAPAAPSQVSVVANLNALQLAWEACQEPDYADSYVWVGATPNFTPTGENLAFVGAVSQTTLSITTEGTKYVRVGHADRFGPPANISDAFEQFVHAIAVQDLKDISELGAEIGDLTNGVREDLNKAALAGLEVLVKTANDSEAAVKNHRQQGVVIKDVEEKADTSASKLSILGVFDLQNQTFVLDQNRVKLSTGEALAERFTTINAKIANNTALISETATASATATGAVASKLAVLGALSPDGSSFIIDQSRVKISPSESIAERFTTINATFQNQSAIITDNAYAAATATQTVANTVATIGALTPDGSSFIINNNTVKVSRLDNGATESIATAFLGIRSDVGLNSSRITEVSNTLSIDVLSATNPVSLARKITAVDARVDGQSGSITTLQDITYDPRGINQGGLSGAVGQLKLKYGVALNNNGHVVGFQINNGGAGASDFTIVADRFAIVDPSAPYNRASPFVYSGGVIRMSNVVVDTLAAESVTTNSLQLGAVVTDKIQANAVSAMSYSENGSTTALYGTQQHLATGYVSQGGPLSIDVYAEVGATGSIPFGATVFLYVDGNLIAAAAVYCPANWGQSGLSFPALSYSAAGSHNITVTYSVTPGSGSGQINRTTVRIMELKR